MYPLFSRARQWVLTYCIICMSSVHSAYHICLLRVDQFCTVHANNNLLANSVLMFVQCIDIICKSPKRSWAFFFFLYYKNYSYFPFVCFNNLMLYCFYCRTVDSIRLDRMVDTLLHIRCLVSLFPFCTLDWKFRRCWILGINTLFTYMCRDIHSRYLVCNIMYHVSI